MYDAVNHLQKHVNDMLTVDLIFITSVTFEQI